MYHDYILEQLEEQKKQEEAKTQQEAETPTNANDDTAEESWPHSKIRFNLNAITYFEVKSRSMITSTESRSIWYQASDFSRISSLNRGTVKMMREFGTVDDESEHCIRGLEHKLHGESERVKDIKVNSIYAVLKEQSKQRKSATKDEQKIAHLYREHTFSCLKKAQERGVSDETEARLEEQDRVDRRRSSMAFDDFDLKELQDLDLHDDMDRFEWRMSGVQTPTEVYEERNGEKASRKKPSKMKKLGDALKLRSMSPKRDSGPNRGSRSKSPKPGDGSGPRRTLSNGFSKLLGSNSNRDTSPIPPSSSHRKKDVMKELPLPGKRNQISSTPKTGMRKSRSDVF